MSPLSDIIQYNDRPPGYFAPRLEGIWARFPYLHNASVPSILDLLNHPLKRPQLFSLKDAGKEYRFDPKSLGLTKVSVKTLSRQLQKRRRPRWIYNTRLIGQSNQGHYFKSFEKLTETHKRDLIEYLKTL